QGKHNDSLRSQFRSFHRSSRPILHAKTGRPTALLHVASKAKDTANFVQRRTGFLGNARGLRVRKRAILLARLPARWLYRCQREHEPMSGEPVAQRKQKQSAKWRLPMVTLVALATAGAYLGIKTLQPRTGIEKGDAAPAFKLTRYAGGTVSLKELRSKV